MASAYVHSGTGSTKCPQASDSSSSNMIGDEDLDDSWDVLDDTETLDFILDPLDAHDLSVTMARPVNTGALTLRLRYGDMLFIIMAGMVAMLLVETGRKGLKTFLS